MGSRDTNRILAAVAAIEDRDFEEAEWLLMQVDDSDPPTHQTALFYRSRIQCERGDHDGSLALLRRALKATRAAYLKCYVGACLQHLDRWTESELPLIDAIREDPRMTDAFILLGNLMRHEGRPLDAVRSYEQAIFLDSRALVARFSLAQLCLEMRDPKRALAQLHIMRGLEPDYWPARRLQVEIYLGIGDRRQALVELCWLVEQGHGDVWAFTAMGYSFDAIGEKTQALFAFENALRLDPELIGVAAAAAKINEELKRYGSALSLYQKLALTQEWARRAENALDRLDRKLAFCRLMGEPENAPIEFSGFTPPRVVTRAKPSLGLLASRDLRTHPLGRLPRPTETEPFAESLKSKRASAATGVATAPLAQALTEAHFAPNRPEVVDKDKSPAVSEPLAFSLARNVASITSAVALDPSALLQKFATGAMPQLDSLKKFAAKGFKRHKHELLSSAIDALQRLQGNKGKWRP